MMIIIDKRRKQRDIAGECCYDQKEYGIRQTIYLRKY